MRASTAFLRRELGHALHRLRPRGHGRRVIRRTLVASSCVVSTTLVRTEINRIAHTESLFRDVNERIAETAENLGSEDAVFVCECADAGCDERLPAHRSTTTSKCGTTACAFSSPPGHEESEHERVLDRRREFRSWRRPRVAGSPRRSRADPRSDEPRADQGPAR